MVACPGDGWDGALAAGFGAAAGAVSTGFAVVGAGVTGCTMTGEGVVTGGVGAAGGATTGAGSGGAIGAAGGAGAGSTLGATGCAGWEGGFGAIGLPFDRTGGGCCMPGAGTAGTEGTGLKLSSSSSGMPSAIADENCAVTSTQMQAAVAAKDRKVMPPLQSLLSFAGAFAMN